MSPKAPEERSAAADESSVSLADKLRFLSRSSAYPDAPGDVTRVETHMSYVFLAGAHAYKLKKPVRFPFLDFSTVEAREADAREEVRLNRRLAPQTYLGTLPLVSREGGLSLGGEGRVVDWLVEMRRLPRGLTLDRLLGEGPLDESRVEALAQTLGEFYRAADRTSLSPQAYAARFLREHAESRNVLMRRDFALDHGRVPAVLGRVDALLRENRALLEERVRQGRVVDGHGDLRPDHICFCAPIAIFDCLEFNWELRQVDPFDELAFLGVECALLGDFSLGPKLVARVAQALGDAPPAPLLSLYAATRAVLRARLAVAHLLDDAPRTPEKWEPLAARYMGLAETALAEAD